MKRRLFDLAFDVVMDTIDIWDKNHVTKLILPHRSEKLDLILHEAKNHHLHCDGKGNHIDKLWATLPCLINSKMYKRFDTTDWTEMRCQSSTLSNSRFQEFIRCLGSNTPNLEELLISCPFDLGYSLEERELASIAQLRNLKSLNILNVLVPLSGFLKLTRQCDKLERIFVAKVGIDVEPSSDAFSDKFVFVDIEAYSLHERILCLNLESTMPATQKIYSGFTHYTRLHIAPRNVDQIGLVRRFTRITEIKFWSSELKDDEIIDEFPHFPQVKFAQFDCRGRSAHTLRRFLNRNGQTLQRLTLKEIATKENMTFNEIFTPCPNLRSLNIECSNLSGNDASAESMHRLKKLKWHDFYDDYPDPVAFSSILFAPLLEQLDIKLPNVDILDFVTVIPQIRRREILPNFKKFTISCDKMNNFDQDQPVEFSVLQELLNELKGAIDSLK
ncbi:Hypothetical predicted protein [Cloeon dipterum]|nr:Hypothetical predicted protein [Cloeon dipterum]